MSDGELEDGNFGATFAALNVFDLLIDILEGEFFRDIHLFGIPFGLFPLALQATRFQLVDHCCQQGVDRTDQDIR